MGNEISDIISDIQLCKECGKPATVFQKFEHHHFTFDDSSKYNIAYNSRYNVWQILTCKNHIIKDKEYLEMITTNEDKPFRQYFLP